VEVEEEVEVSRAEHEAVQHLRLQRNASARLGCVYHEKQNEETRQMEQVSKVREYVHGATLPRYSSNPSCLVQNKNEWRMECSFPLRTRMVTMKAIEGSAQACTPNA